MNSERWQQIKEIFSDALQREPKQRDAFLVAACADDGDLRAEVEKLLNSYETDFLAQPAIGEVADTIVGTRQQLKVGQRLGRYRITQPIGKGGMGEVYLAHDTELERDVALKILSVDVAADQQRMQRFIQEAKTASALNHPNIITIHEVGQAEGLRFIAMEYIKGENLRQRLRREPLSLHECFEVAVQVAAALAAAHEAKVVHRDIKPENIMLRPDGLVKVLDFGLAKLTEGATAVQSLGAEAATRLQINTAPGVVMGTFNYMSPEQARGKEVDLRTDIWSFGVVLYEMLTGRLPFAGESSSDVIAAILKSEAPSLTTNAPDTPAELQRIVKKTLRKERDERYHTVKDLLTDLKSLQRESDLAAEIERSMPAATRSATSEATLSGVSTAQSSTALPVTAESVLTASSAEYIVTQIKTHKRSALVAFAAVIVAAALLSYFFYAKRNHISALTDSDTILLTDFDNKTGDAIFDGTLKQGLAVQLGQSPFLNLFPDTRVRDTLKLMNRSPDDRVTIDVGREVCERQGLKALIAGSIAPLGSHFVITLEAINGRSGEVVAREQTEADSKEQVLKALSTAAGSLREKLGESLSSIQKFDAPLEDTTSSLEALKAYSQGSDIQLKGKFFDAMPFFKHAIELDKDFALAYGLLAWMYDNTGQKKMAAEYAAKGYALKDRVSEQEKFRLSVQYFRMTTGEVDKAIETLTLYEQTYPRIYNAPILMGASYAEIGQWEKAIAEDRKALTLNPNVVHGYAGEARALTALNRFNEAKAIYAQALQQKLDASKIHAGLFQVAFVENDTAIMQQQIDWSRGQPDEYLALNWQAGTAAFAGQWRKAQDLSQQAIDLATRSNVKAEAARYAAEQALRVAVFGKCDQTRTYVTQSLALERNQITLSRTALALALCDQAVQSQSLIDELIKEYPKDTLIKGIWLPTIRAASELQHGGAAKAVELLEETKRYEPAAEFWTHYLRGQAFMKLNQGSEAAAEFKQILEHRGEAPLSVLYPLAQLGLARAAQQTGDSSEAVKPYEDFLAIWKDADADLPVLQSARAERGKSK